MTHWFDTLSKKAARSEGMERRSFLAFGTVLGFGAMGKGAEAADAPPRLAHAAPRSPVLPAGQPRVAQTALGMHVRRTAGPLVIHEITTAKSGLELKSSLAFNRTTLNATISTTVSRGAGLVAKLDFAMTKGGSGTLYINYGPGVAGVNYVTASTKNGKTFQGTADGRPFTITGSQVQFLDHGAPPQTIKDPAVLATVRALDEQSRALFRTNPAPVTAPVSPRPKASIGALADARRAHAARNTNECGPHRPIITPPGEDWYEPGEDEVECQNCENNCGTNVGSWIADIFSFGTAEPEYYAVCMAACNLPHGGCLPNPCGGDWVTCASTDTCFDNGNLCCPSPSAICNGACCGTFITSCGSDGTCGCEQGTSVCGQDCCNPGQACCNGTCCPNGEVCTDGICCKPHEVTCKGICCDKGLVCHGGKCCHTNNICGPTCCDELATCLDDKKGVCCGFDQPKCGGICCPLGAVCLNGKCCEPNNVCGGICCPVGEACINPSKHICSKCPDGQTGCISTNGIGICCPHDVDCCGSTCCKPGQVCQPSGKNWVCAAPTPIQ